MFEQYQSSGRIGALGIPAMLIAALGVGVGLGIVYAYVIAWIPIIYVSILATGGFAFALGFSISLAGSLGHVRNGTIAHVFGLFAGLVGLYAAWAWDGYARFEGEYPVCWDPQQLWVYVNMIYENGAWGMGDTPVTGIPLGIIWAIEALIIVGASTLLAGSTASLPYCESCGKWTEETEDFKRLLPPENEEALQQLCEGNLDVLTEFTACAPGKPLSIRLDVHACPECDDTRYLTVNLARITVNDEGEESDDTTEIVEHMVLSAEKMEWLERTCDALPVEEDPDEPVANNAEDDADDAG